MKSQVKHSNFVIQAILLAAAGIMVRMIGLFYTVPLTAIIGDLGNGYYLSAYYIYSIILLICSYSVPMAISKVISVKYALEEYRTADRVWKAALLYVGIIGGTATVLTFSFASRIVDVPEAALALKILAPTIFLSGILGVLRGFFQARKTMVPTAISQLVEAIANAGVSVGAAWIFTRPYARTNDTISFAKYGAAGSALGTGAGVMVGLIFMIVLYGKQKGAYKRLLTSDSSKIQSYRTVFKLILCMITPVILSTFIYNISTLVDMKIFYKIMAIKKMEVTEIASLYGIYGRKYATLVNIPIALASAMVSAIVPQISAAYETGKIKNTNHKIMQAVRCTMVFSIPAAVGMSVLAKPVMDLLFWGTSEVAANLLKLGSITVIFYGMTTLTNGVLQGIGKVNIPIVNSLIALVIHLFLLIPLLLFTDAKLYGILVAALCYSIIMCMLNEYAVHKYLGYHQEYKKTFLMPAFVSMIMGGVTWIVYKGSYDLSIRFLTNSMRMANGIGVAISICIAMILYFIGILKIGAITKEELVQIPMGKKS